MQIRGGEKDMKTLQDLRECFSGAEVEGKKYIGVKIEMQGFPKAEIIINEAANFEYKCTYYEKTYNNDLTLKSFNGIKIIDFAYGNSFEAIELQLAK
jgi:hypothetical protein